jgi:hypothetical protein
MSLEVRSNPNGNEEWNLTFGGLNSDEGQSIQQTSDGGFIITGGTHSYGAGGCDVWLIRLAAEENEIFKSPTSSPTEFVLSEAFQNPFNSRTTISVELHVSTKLKLTVFNITGQEVAVIADEKYSEGYQQFIFNAEGFSSGIYFIHAFVPGKMNELRKVVLIR